MIPLNIILDGTNAWPDLRDKPVIEAMLTAVAALPGGMASGQPSIGLRIDLPDGQTVIAQTSFRLFTAASKAFLARYGEPT